MGWSTGQGRATCGRGRDHHTDVVCICSQCVRLITSALHHQKDPYEFTLVPEVSYTALIGD